MLTRYTNGGLFSAVLCFALGSCAPAPNKLLNAISDPACSHTKPLERAFPSLSADRLIPTITVLAGDSMEGRATGTRGFDNAAIWVAGEFSRNHIFPYGSSYFQNFSAQTRLLKEHLKVSNLSEDTARTRNVIAWIEGSDPVLKHEFVVLTAHLDHLGREGDSIYHGANDNASGVSVVLGIAEAMEANHLRPKRSVMFILFSGEEAGLLGSGYFVENPVIDLRTIRFLVNLDLVGSGKEGMMIQGYDHFPTEFEIIKTVNASCFHFELGTRPNSPNSDQFFFNRIGVPAFFFYTYNGTSPYHLPGDTADKIDRAVLENTARFVMTVVWKFCN